MPVLLTCPHCAAGDLEPGATGLDLCTRCGGLSRDGHPLPRNRPFQGFDAPKMLVLDLDIVTIHGVLVAALLVDGAPAVAVTFVLPDGKRLPPFLLTAEVAGSLVKMAGDALTYAERTTQN